MKSRLAPRLSELAVLATGALAIALFCYLISRHRILWSDEVFGYLLVTDPSWHHMLFAWREGADGGGLAFYILGRLWLLLFGHSVLSFRAFSAAGCFLGFAATWSILRRYYTLPIAILAPLLTWFGSETILWQMVQTRFYGLLLGAAALALLAAVQSAEEWTSLGRNRPSTLALTVFANALLIETHPFGLLYSGTILAGCIAADLLARRRRKPFYLAAIAPWPLLAFSIPAMLASAKFGKPWFWTLRPTRFDLLFTYFPIPLPHVLHASAVLLLLALIFRPTRARLRAAVAARSHLLLPGLALILTPVLFYLVSRHGTSYFVARYFIPFTLGVCLLGAEVLAQIWLFLDEFVYGYLAFAGLAAVLLLHVAQYATIRYPKELVLPPRDFTPILAAELPPGIPIVFERVDLFAIMRHYLPGPEPQLRFVLDWPIAIAPETPRDFVSGYHEMETWQRVGYYPGSIEQSSAFLAHTDRFIVVHYDQLHWFDQRILNQPQWQTTRIGDFNFGPWSESLWLVQRRPWPAP